MVLGFFLIFFFVNICSIAPDHNIQPRTLKFDIAVLRLNILKYFI